MKNETFITAALLGAAQAIKMGTQTNVKMLSQLGSCVQPAKGADAYAPSDAEGVRSVGWDNLIDVTFDNQSDRELSYKWVSYDGEDVSYQSSRGHDERDQSTYATHPWRVYDSQGEVCVFLVHGAQSYDHFYFTIDESGACHVSKEQGSVCSGCVLSSEGGRAIEGEADLQSTEWDTPIDVHFENDSNLELYYYWQDYSGGAVYYQSSKGFDTRSQQTYATHPWTAWHYDGNDWSLICTFVVDEAWAYENFYFGIDKDGGCTISEQEGKVCEACEGTTVYVSEDVELMSTEWDTSIDVTFDNNSNLALDYYWQDYSGGAVHYQSSHGSDTRSQQTYATHPWSVWYGNYMLCAFVVDEATAHEHFFFTIDEDQRCFITTESGNRVCV